MHTYDILFYIYIYIYSDVVYNIYVYVLYYIIIYKVNINIIDEQFIYCHIMKKFHFYINRIIIIMFNNIYSPIII